MADILYTFDDPPSTRHIDRAFQVLATGGIIAFPTDTHWAFGCDGANPRGVEALLKFKPGKAQPLAILCSSISMVSQYALLSNLDYRLAKKILPGPYTLILNASKNLHRSLRDRRKNVGVRVPNAPLIVAMIERLGRPIASTSAPEIAPGRTASYGSEIFENFGHSLDLILDLGRVSSELDSTILDLSEGTPKLIRQGAGDLTGLAISESEPT